MNLLRRIIAALRRRPAPHRGGWQDFETGRYVTDPAPVEPRRDHWNHVHWGMAGAPELVTVHNGDQAHRANPAYLMWNERIPSTPTEKAMDAIRDAVEEIKLQPWQIEFLRRTAPDVYVHLRKIGALDQHPFPLRLSIHNAVRGNADATVYGMPIRVTPLVPRGEVWVQDSESLAMPYRFSIDETGTVVPKGWT